MKTMQALVSHPSGELKLEEVPVPELGSNRYALSLGLNYALMPGVNVKGEYRYDRSSGNVFRTSGDTPQYRRDNHVVGVSTVVSF